MTDRDPMNEIDGAISVPFDPDMGLFPPATERVFRFFSTVPIEQAIATSEGSIEIVTVGSGFPWIAAMQRNEHLKRCDSVAKDVMSETQVMQHASLAPLSRLRPVIKPYIRSALTNVLFDPPMPDISDKRPHKVPKVRAEAMAADIKDYFMDSSEVLQRQNEPAPEEYRRNGGWEAIAPVPALSLRDLLAKNLDLERADAIIEEIAGALAYPVQHRARPYNVRVLDTRSTDELLTQADVMFDRFPDVKETHLYSSAVALAEQHIVQDHPHDLSSLEDDSATAIVASHWPLRHNVTGNVDDEAGWALLLQGLHNKLKMNGIGIFFPWDLPNTFDGNHKDITLGGVQSMMVNEYGFEVSVAADQARDVMGLVAMFGIEAALLTPQLRRGGQANIGRLIARKRQTFKAVVANHAQRN